MTSANGRGSKGTVLLYTRVSTAEQASKGFSLSQQEDALRKFASSEGYEILQVVSDPGESGATLSRPGLDRLRALVEGGGVAAVLVQDRDRLAREPAYLYILREEFAQRGTKICAMNADGDDGTPEGEFSVAIIDQIAKYERAKTRERTSRGRRQRAKDGRVVFGGNRPNYGFRPDDSRATYVVDEEEMKVVRRIFRHVAEGGSLHGLRRALDREGVPTPGGGPRWATRTFMHVIRDDTYRPHDRDDLEALARAGNIPGAVAANAPRPCGVWWFGRRRTTRTRVADGSGGYRTVTRVQKRPREEWVGVPVPDAGVPLEHVEAARCLLAENPRPVSNSWGRSWELSGGLFRCVCGRKMTQIGTQTGTKKFPYFYYACSARRENKGSCPNDTANVRAEGAEEAVWQLVRGLVTDPERLRMGLDAHVEQERAKAGGDPGAERKGWAAQLTDADRKRAKYQEMFAADAMSMDELKGKLAELGRQRTEAETALAEIAGRDEKLKELERDREATLRAYGEAAPEALDALDGEGRNSLYRALSLAVTAHP
ncbi:MAG: recombinase family protein, partial [Actinomycetota bacterium]|nr:recombinase family protein [Actinomycetota bacterium]